MPTKVFKFCDFNFGKSEIKLANLKTRIFLTR